MVVVVGQVIFYYRRMFKKLQDKISYASMLRQWILVLIFKCLEIGLLGLSKLRSLRLLSLLIN
jgi:hypothetical protein